MSYKFINDAPVNSAKQGAHQKLADAISNKIDQNHNIIALYGQWGSGKSSVVRLLSNALGAELIEFDIWHHTGDMLRRSFLAKLTENIIIDNKYSPENLEKQDTGLPLKKIISGQYKDITTIVTDEAPSETQKILIAIILSWLLWVIVLPIFDINKKIWNFSFQISKSFNFELLLALSITSIICYGILSWTQLKTFLKILSFKASLQTTSNTSQSTVLQNQDITEQQFQKIYKIILDHITKGDKNYLICLDNLDRMSTEKASSMLDELNMFLSIAKGQKNIYFIVPVDDGALTSVINYHSNEEISGVFIHKLFPISFRLPDMINFEWRSFMKDKLMEAGINETEHNSIISAFNICRYNQLVPNSEENSTEENLPHTKPLTPRDMIFYINKIVSLHAELSHIKEITLSNIAWYAGIIQFNTRRDYNRYFSKIYGKHANFLNKLSKESIEQLYSIHYQTGTPYETLYKERLWNAIETADPEEMSPIAKKIPGTEIQSLFIGYLDQTVTSNFEKLEIIVAGIKTLSPEESYSEWVNNRDIVPHLEKSLENYRQWGTDAENDKQRQEILLFIASHATAPELIKKIKLFWEYEQYSYDNATKKWSLTHTQDKSPEREAYFEFLSQLKDPSTYTVDFGKNIQHILISSLAFDNSPDVEDLYKYYPNKEVTLIPTITGWLTPTDKQPHVLQDVLKKYANALGHLDTIPFSSDDRKQVLEQLRELCQLITASLSEDTTNNNKPEIYKILLECIKYLIIQNNEEDYKDIFTEEFWETPTPARTYPYGSSSISMSTIWDYLIMEFRAQPDYFYISFLALGVYFPNSLESTPCNHFLTPILTMLFENLKDSNIKRELRLKLVQAIKILLPNLYTSNFLPLLQTNFQEPQIREISIELIKDPEFNVAILPSKWTEDEDIRKVITENIQYNDFINLILPSWKQQSHPVGDKEWEYLRQYCEAIFINKNIEELYNNPSEPTDEKDILELLTKHPSVKEYLENSFLLKILEKAWNSLFLKKDFIAFYEIWKGISSENIQKRCKRQFLNNSNNDLAFTDPHIFQNALSMELNPTKKELEDIIKELDRSSIDDKSKAIDIIQRFEGGEIILKKYALISDLS